jgi:hypothetical protein
MRAAVLLVMSGMLVLGCAIAVPLARWKVPYSMRISSGDGWRLSERRRITTYDLDGSLQLRRLRNDATASAHTSSAALLQFVGDRLEQPGLYEEDPVRFSRRDEE